MDKKPQNNRSSAAREFMSSLDELRTVLGSDVDAEVERQRPYIEAPSSAADDTGKRGEADLETLLQDAAQDIERFMAEHPDGTN